ncbi:MAG: hypothetical protein NTZ05_18115 [Chloroflexi bacterium]|nr:hypothetical protein [Chloroflexota bacterium]
METPVEARDSSPVIRSIQLLEDEHRQTKGVTFKLQQQLDQLQSALWAQGDRMHALEQLLASLTTQTHRIGKLDEEIRQAREMIDRLQEFQSEQNERWAGTERARTVEQERDRQDMAQVLHKIDQLEHDLGFLRGRIQSMDEVQRRVQDAIVEVGQRTDNLAQTDESLSSRMQTISEQLKRKDQEIGRLDGEQDMLRKQDELVLGRVQVLGEQVRRVEDMEPLRDLGVRLGNEFNERLELHRVERQRLERSLLDMELHQEQQRSRIEEVAQHANQVDTKTNSQADYIAQIREHLWTLRDEVATQLAEISRVEELQKRRQMADLEQQLLELKNRSSRSLARPGS